jgi:hypothetical protein
MDKRLSYRAMLVLGVSLALLPVSTRADFIIEFTDGRQVTVGRYVDEGQTIKIYTPQGAIAFRKDDVKRITEVGANQSANTRLEAATARPSAPAQASALGPSDGKEAAKASGKAIETGQEKTAAGGKATEAERERIEEQYQDVSQRYNEIWKKHSQDFRSGASDEVLTENRRVLLELDQERKALKKEARQRVAPDDLPTWAQ